MVPSSFDLLPSDLLWFIGMKLDFDSLESYGIISRRFYQLLVETGQLTELMRHQIQEVTRLDSSSFTRRQMGIVSRMNHKKGRISTGGYSSMVLDTQNQIYCFGDNRLGQLGLGDYENKKIPTLMRTIHGISNDAIIIKISSGGSQALILNSQGKIYGVNGFDFGRLWCGIIKHKNIPELIPFTNPEIIVEISAGRSHYLILDSKGQVFSLGSNEIGQLGLGDIEKILTLTLVPLSRPIMAISAKENSSLILSREGQVFGFGNNSMGQLGLENRVNVMTPTLIEHFNHLTEDPQVIVDLSTGGDHSLFLNSQGQVFSCGSDEVGQLGLGGGINSRSIPTLIGLVNTHLPYQKANPFITVSAGGSHSLILDIQGRVFGFGNNIFGQLGLDDTRNRSIPTLVDNFPNIIAISAGTSHSLICNSQGQIFSFGFNMYGQIGLGDNVGRSLPTLIEGLIV
jgi:alpha-tubulin suppressor-like RCC1 family protein